MVPRAELPTYLSSSAQQDLGMAEVLYGVRGWKSSAAWLLVTSLQGSVQLCHRSVQVELGRALSPQHPASRGSFLSRRIPALEGFAVEPAPSSVPAERLFRAGEALEELLGII